MLLTTMFTLIIAALERLGALLVDADETHAIARGATEDRFL